jgi:hypothetical protein
MSSMKPLIAVVLIVAGAALPAGAQRGGARGGSVGHSGGFAVHSGGFAVHSAPPSRGSFPSVGRAPFMGTPQFRDGGAPANLRLPARGPMAIDSRRGPIRPVYDRDRRPYIRNYGVGYVYAYPGYIGSDYLSYPDYGPYDDSSYVAPQPPPSYPPNESEAPPADQFDTTPSTAYRPAYVRPQPAQEPEAETPVTLIYKDGRPPEQIQNYILTRTTLYVQQSHPREIPVDQLDLAATQKVNKDAGLEFQLPAVRR